MKIAVNTRFLIKDKMEGIGVFTFETFKRIAVQHPDHEFYFLFDRPYDDEFIFSENIKPVVLWPPARHPILWYIWFEISVKRAFKKIQPDVFVSPDGYLPLHATYPTLAVIHDLAFEHYPKDVPALVSKYYRYFFSRFARQASRIATVSEYSKKDIKDIYHIPGSKIDVVYNGASEIFKPISEKEIKNTRESVSSGKAYFIYVGALHQRKNIQKLLLAYDKFRELSKEDVKLVICGRKFGIQSELDKIYSGLKHKSDIIFAGRVSLEKLAQLTAGALAMVNVSYFEGFGIPLVEAMNCHVPLIVSNNTSFPEMAGETALLVDPFDVNAIAEAMKTLAEDESKRQELIRAAQKRKNLFNWDRTADLLWESINKTLQIK